MTAPIVLVHGGGHGAWCWQRLLPHLEAPTRAVELPPVSIRGGAGRHDSPPGLGDITLADFADATLAAVDEAGFDRFVLVGHSMGGLTVTEVARRVPERVVHMVFVSACVPPQGGTIVDTLPPELREMSEAAGRQARAGGPAGAAALPDEMIRQLFCNDMNEEQTRFVLDHCGTEAGGVLIDPVDRAAIPAGLPKTYVRLRRDQALDPATQDQMIANLEACPGGTVAVVEINAGHDVMISDPAALAAALTPR